MARNNHQESETARAGVRDATDRAEDVAQTGIAAARRVAEEFGRVLGVGGQNENLTRQASQNLEAITETGSVLIRGFQDVSREWLELMQERLRRNAEGMTKLAQCRTLPDLAAAGTRIYDQAVAPARSRTRSAVVLRRSSAMNRSNSREIVASGSSRAMQSVNLVRSSSGVRGFWWLPFARSIGPLSSSLPPLVRMTTESAGANDRSGMVSEVVWQVTRPMSSWTSGRSTNTSVRSDRPTLRATMEEAMAKCMLNFASSPVWGRWLRSISICVSPVDTRIESMSAGLRSCFCARSRAPSMDRCVA